MEEDAKKDLWFNFVLKAIGTNIEELRPSQFEFVVKFVKNDGKVLGVIDQEVEYNIKIKSMFEIEFCNKGGHPFMKGSDVDWCFENYLLPLPDFIEDSYDLYYNNVS